MNFSEDEIKRIYQGWQGNYASHPYSPSGGGGLGGFSQAGPICSNRFSIYSIPNPDSPVMLLWSPEKIQKNFSAAKLKSSFPTQLNWDEVKADFERWEGKFSYMYLDTKGLVTVGIGKMLPNVAAAKNLGFTRRGDGMRATAAEIETDFNEVAKQPKGKLAASYQKHTKLDLPDDVIYDLLKIEVDKFEKSLKAHFKGYDSYPVPAKRALLDMAYNLGIDGLLKFKKLKKAVEKQKWKEAANDSHRIGPSEERNQWTHDMFMAADKP